MSRARPDHIPPKSWLLSKANDTTAGATKTLNDTGWNPGPAKYGPGTNDLILAVNGEDSGDAEVLDVNIQLLSVVGVNPQDVDVLIEASWGVQGGQNNAFFKVGNGLVFSVPANYLRVTAQNLLSKTQVTASCAPYAGRSNGNAGYLFNFGDDGSYAIVVSRFVDYFKKSSPSPPPPAFQNNTPAPYIIPPYATSVTMSINLGTPGNVYNIVQVAAGGAFVRVDSVTVGAGGFAVLKDVELGSDTTKLNITWDAPGNPVGNFTLDFAIGL